jgi:prepilin-type N-terminal cleavage/methylation domain-containing protein
MRSALRKQRKGGFTLLEMALVVLLISILLAIAIPEWIRAHQRGCERSCISNLRQIEQAKERFAIEYRKPNGAEVAWSDLIPAYLKQQPECPASGNYNIEAIGTNATCSITGHNLP